MTGHNKYGLLGGGGIEKGSTTSRSEVLPFSILMFDEEEGWAQYGVSGTIEEAREVAVALTFEYDLSSALIVDTNAFLDVALRDDEPIWEPPGRIETVHKPEKMTPEQVEEAIQGLLQLGLVEDSGERRNGKIVWRASAKSKDPVYREKMIRASEQLDNLEEFSD
jgi:hypothetical protein